MSKLQSTKAGNGRKKFMTGTDDRSVKSFCLGDRKIKIFLLYIQWSSTLQDEVEAKKSFGQIAANARIPWKNIFITWTKVEKIKLD